MIAVKREAPRFEGPPDFLRAVFTAETTGRVDPRLAMYAAAGSDENMTISDPHGGFMVPEALVDPDLSAALEGTDHLASRVFHLPMPTLVFKLPFRVDKNHTSSVSDSLTIARPVQTSAMTNPPTQVDNHTL